MKVFITRDCVNSRKAFIAAKSVIDIDEEKEKKLLDLGLAVEYDEKIHGEAKEDAEAKVSKLEEENKAAVLAKEDAEAKVSKLEGFVEAAIASGKGTAPKGWDEYKESKE